MYEENYGNKYETIEQISPLLSVLILLRDLQFDIGIISRSMTNINREILKEKDINVTETPYEMTPNILNRTYNVKSYRNKLRKYLMNT